MSFLIQRVVGRGLSLSEVSGDVLRIGRGTRAELRSENPAVALDHAVIETTAAGYTITDGGSITGTYVNSRPVETAPLSKGDVIEIGDLRIEIQVAEPGQPLFMRVGSTTAMSSGASDEPEEQEAPAAPAGGTIKAPRVDYGKAFQLSRPYLTRTTLTALVMIACLTLIGEVTRPQKQTAFAPGSVSAAHARAVNDRGQSIANDCSACHDPWRGVTDTRCQSCHGRMVHALKQAAPPPCASCHAEHRGATTLASIPDSRCVACHANLAAHATGRTQVANAIAFGPRHPEFTLPTDGDTLRLNHRLHLQRGGVFNGNGQREVLSCTSCHRLVETKGKLDPAPIRFATDCQRCHRLTFDAAFPDAEVPHGGDPSLVYGFVLATYSGNRDIAGKAPEEVRRILTERPPEANDERAVLAAEQVVKVKCSVCHEVRRAGGRLAVTPPVIPTRWMDAKFSHGPHRELACETCHAGARQSFRTADVLLPMRSACTDCHGERRTAGLSVRASSSCVLCHGYHGRSSQLMPKVALASLSGGAVRAEMEGGLGMLGSILLVFIGLLLLVVFVPVGLALYQRMRPVRTESPAASPAPAPRPAAVNVPPLTADSLRTNAVTPTPAPAPPIASPPAIEATQVVRKEALQPDAPAPTQMLQWNGMLRCTAGPIEGKTFIIDDQGFYIGRDPALSTVVINDTRVSKRHVRIVPRNGKVWAIDQSSTNGTFLGKAGGERITEVQLKRGDVLVLGDNAATFVYQI